MRKLGKNVLALMLVIPLVSCADLDRTPKIGDGIITTKEVTVRNSVATLALDVATLKQGDEVEILEEREDGWVKIRTASGIEGWVEAPSVTDATLVRQANALAERLKNVPVQAVGRLSGPTTLRASPGRASDDNAILTLPRNTRVELLGRQRTVRRSHRVEKGTDHPRSSPPQRRASTARSEGSPEYEEWWKVRLPDSSLVHAGWVYAPLVDLQIPPRLVRLQEDYNIIGWFEVGHVVDQEIGPATHYLAMERRRGDASAGTDFSRLQLYLWHPTQHQYRRSSRPVRGMLPVLPERTDGAWVFRVNALNRRTGQLETRRYLVDVRNPLRPRFVRLRR